MSKLVATYDFTMDGRDWRRGDELTEMDESRAKSLKRQGAFMSAEDWAKRKPQADANWSAAIAERDSMAIAHAGAKADRDARLQAEAEARGAGWRG
jgi:hypothetical protein